jgi:thioesterase domain-containing protein
LGDSQTFYGFQAQGVDGKLPPLNSIEKMAELYYNYLRQTQPSGPYLLAGYSGGGLIAHKIAQMLHYDEEYVGLLVLLDTDYPSMLKRHSTLKEHLRLMYHFGVVAYTWPRLKRRTCRALSRFQRWQQQAQSEVIPYELRKEVIYESFQTACERLRSPHRPLSATQNNWHNPKLLCSQWVRCFHLGQESLGWPTP